MSRRSYDTRDLLRLATAGSVDDGKSTLIGRLLHDAKAILADQFDDLRGRDGEVDLSRLTDGLRAEREQGITIDVAYRYFATQRRTFILADTPGHVQYTRNMVTGASTADLAVVLIDARHGVVEQTRRHAFIASLLRIPHIVVAVNKMDLVGYAEDAFDAVVRDFPALGTRDVTFIPLSALKGDNVVDRSGAMGWYAGPPLLEHLERVDIAHDRDAGPLRFPVQYVIRDGAGDYRGYAGRVAGGVVRPGDEVVVLPSGVRTTVASVDTYDGPLDAAPAGRSVTLRLADDVDVSRGDMICAPAGAPQLTRELHADVAWMAQTPLRAGGRYAIKRSTTTARAIVDVVEDRLDVATLERRPGSAELGLNDIGRVTLRTSTPVAADPYATNRATGSFILIDEATNDTVGAGMITS
ncbi:MAG: sulfate adenylyltransferase subunit 1 [Solirubrobacteraceae bacterium]